MQILLFGNLKHITHCAEITLSCTEADADGAWYRPRKAHPGLEPGRRSVRLARNPESVSRETRSTDQDGVALIPPVSGG